MSDALVGYKVAWFSPYWSAWVTRADVYDTVESAREAIDAQNQPSDFYHYRHRVETSSGDVVWLEDAPTDPAPGLKAQLPAPL